MPTPSLILVPARFKTGKLYTPLATTSGGVVLGASGDFNVTRATTATRVNASGLIEVVASGIPRLDYYTSGGTAGCPALLVEPSGSNLLQRSEEFENSYWSKSFGNVTQDQTTAPNGLTTADKYVVTNGQPLNSPIIRSFSFAINTTYTLSLFVKKADYDTASIRLNTTETGLLTNSFNLASGTATNNQIQDYGNGWYRVWVSFTTAATVTNGQVQLIRDAQVRDGVAGIFIWGAQLEVGSVPTSYIPTTTASATRNADVVTLSGAVSGCIGQTEGTIYAEVDLQRLVLGSVFVLDVGGTTEYIAISKLATGAFRVSIKKTSTSAVNIITTTTNAVGVYKLALGYKSGDYALYINGVSRGTSTNSTDYPTGSLIQAVVSNTNYGAFNDFLRTPVTLYTTRLTDAQLQALTTL